jgi:hypothetical protein
MDYRLYKETAGIPCCSKEDCQPVESSMRDARPGTPPYAARCSGARFLEEDRGVFLTALDIVLGATLYPHISNKQAPNRANGPFSLPPALRS